MEVDGGGIHGNHDADNDNNMMMMGRVTVWWWWWVMWGRGGEVGDDESVVVYVDDCDGGDVHAYHSCDNDGGILSPLVAD